MAGDGFGANLAMLKAFLGSEGGQDGDGYLAGLLRRANGDVERAANLHFEATSPKRAPPPQPQAPVNPLKRPAPAQHSPQPAPAKQQQQQGQIKRTRTGSEYFLGEFVCFGHTMFSGSSPVRPGDVVELDRRGPPLAATAPKGSGRAGGFKAVDNIIVRIISATGNDIGRLKKDVAGVVAKLLDFRAVDFEVQWIDDKAAFNSYDDVLLSVRVFLRPDVFALPFLSTSSPANDENRREFKTCFVALLQQFLCLSPTRGQDAWKQTGAIADQDRDLDEDEKVIEQKDLNALYERAQKYDRELPEMEPAPTMVLSLRKYQKQALWWLAHRESSSSSSSDASSSSSSSNGHDGRDDAMHPMYCEFSANGQLFYLNPFSGEMLATFPAAVSQSAGGILADEMGLGKTIEVLSLIHSNRFDKTKPVPNLKPGTRVSKATLIIAPMSLLGQWKREIEKSSVADSLCAYMFYGNDRNDENLAEYDCVLTSYGTLASEFARDPSGSIFNVHFHRVCLDEAHMIKSRQTQVAQACYAVQATRRWVITGTPIQNRIEDLYSLFCFLKVEPWCHHGVWRALIAKPFEKQDPKGLETLQTVLQPLVLRRTKSMKDSNGQPIVLLPSKDEVVEFVDFSDSERDFYTAVYTRSQIKFNDYVRNGAVAQNFLRLFNVLMRLRQCCCHPFLVMTGHSDDDRTNHEIFGDVDALIAKFTDADDGQNKEFVASVVSQVLQQAAATPGDAADEESGATEDSNVECPICYEPIQERGLMPCLHSGCFECLLSFALTRQRNNQPVLCPMCNKGPFKESDIVRVKPPQPKPEQLDPRRHWKTSAKVQALMRDLTMLRDDSGGTAKSVVFSQFTSFLDLIQIPLNLSGIKYLRLDGTMSQQTRETALASFNSDNETQVFLISLRAGGVGLNLTSAQNVFLMDLWWNPAVEQQAVDRVHRIGQTREVHVKRFVVRGTVEERMLGLQSRKKLLSETALRSNGASKEDAQMRIEDMRQLFA